MPLDQIVNIIEIAAAALVVVSLFFVGIQIHQNTRAIRGSTLQMNTDFWGTLFLRLAEHEMASSVRRRNDGPTRYQTRSLHPVLLHLPIDVSRI